MDLMLAMQMQTASTLLTPIHVNVRMGLKVMDSIVSVSIICMLSLVYLKGSIVITLVSSCLPVLICMKLGYHKGAKLLKPVL